MFRSTGKVILSDEFFFRFFSDLRKGLITGQITAIVIFDKNIFRYVVDDPVQKMTVQGNFSRIIFWRDREYAMDIFRVLWEQKAQLHRKILPLVNRQKHT